MGGKGAGFLGGTGQKETFKKGQGEGEKGGQEIENSGLDTPGDTQKKKNFNNRTCYKPQKGYDCLSGRVKK